MTTTRRSKTPDFEEYPKWSEAKFFQFIRSGLRSKWTRWPPKFEVLNAARREYQGDNKRQKYEYKCAKCRKHYPQKEVSVDHIEPVGTLRSFDDLPEFCRRLFVGTSKLQLLCKRCHDKKTAAERKNKNNKE